MKYWFIVNPIFKYSSWIEKIIKDNFKNTSYELMRIKGFYNESKNIEEAILSDMNEVNPYVIAVGGDGTIRIVAEAIVNISNINRFITMGVIPIGSGNMISREFGIPVNNIMKAIALILNPKKVRKIDVIEIRDENILGRKICVGCIGLRISAIVTERYNKSIKKRGFIPYIYHTLRSVKDFDKIRFQKTILEFSDRKEVIERAILLSIQNISLWGFGIKVCNADPEDGLFNCVIMDGNRIKTLIYVIRILRGITPESFLEKKITIIRGKKGVIQLDGDTFYAGKKLFVRILPSSLNVITN